MKRWRSPRVTVRVSFAGASPPKRFVPRTKAGGREVPFAAEIDAVLHEERLDHGRKRLHAVPGDVRELPDGAVIAAAGEAYTIARGRAFRWGAQGYERE